MNYNEKLAWLTGILAKSQKVNALNTLEENQAATLAHAFLDMEESFNVILNELLPKFKNADLDGKDVDDILLDIGEELRHILYHVHDPKYFDYLKSRLE